MTKKLTTIKPIESAITSYKMPDVTIKAIKEFQKAEKLECKDTESRKIIGKHRVDIKSLIKKVDRKRIDNNTDYQEKNNGYAELIKSALTISRDVFDVKIKDYDAIALKKKAKKDLEKKKAAGLIQYHMDGLKVDCESGQEYNLISYEIMGFLTNLREVEISAVDFGEMTEDAEIMLQEGLYNTQAKFDSRVTFEEEQVEQARIKKEQDEKAADLKKKEAKLKADQAKADKKAKEKKAEVNKVAEAVAEKLRLANKKLEDGRLALEREKEGIAAQRKADEDAKQAEIDRKAKAEVLFEEIFYSSDPEDDRVTYDELHKRRFSSNDLVLKDKYAEYIVNLDAELAAMRDQAYDYALIQEQEEIKKRNIRAKKDKKYAKEIEADKEILYRVIKSVNEFISEFNPLDRYYKTDAGAQVELDFIIAVKAAIEKADTAQEAL